MKMLLRIGEVKAVVEGDLKSPLASVAAAASISAPANNSMNLKMAHAGACACSRLMPCVAGPSRPRAGLRPFRGEPLFPGPCPARVRPLRGSWGKRWRDGA